MKGPNGEKRPADVVSRAVMIARIATGEEEETSYSQILGIAILGVKLESFGKVVLEREDSGLIGFIQTVRLRFVFYQTLP